jgi:tetratricopeptide (TPR) repeat protein
MFALLLAELGVRWLRGRLLSRWLRVAATAAVLLMAMRTFAAGADFRSERAYSAALIEADPDSHIGYLQLGSLERFLGRPAQAIPLLEKAVSIDPRSTGGWSLLAWSNLAVGRLEDAHRAARTTLGLDPSDRIARFVLSVVLMRANRQEDAAAVFLPLLAEDSAEVGLWKEAFKAVARFGGDSPFVAALRRAVDDERFRHIRSRLQALLALQAPGTGQAPE